MRIQFENGKLSAIDGTDISSTPTGKLVFAAEWLSRYHSLSDKITGIVDTDLGGVVPPNISDQHKVASEINAVGTPATSGLQRYSFIADGMPGNVKALYDFNGNWVRYADYDKLEKAYLNETNEHGKTTEENKRLRRECAEIKSIAADRADELKKNVKSYSDYLNKLSAALGNGVGWGSKIYTAEELIEQVTILVGNNKINEATAKKWRETAENWHSAIGVALELSKSTPYTLNTVLRMIKSLKDRAEALEACGNAAPVTPVGETIELKAPEHKAVFECTFEWARDNWDLMVDQFLYESIHNSTNPVRQDGYIKVVTTS